jgi:hypothetical protein
MVTCNVTPLTGASPEMPSVSLTPSSGPASVV